MKKITLLVAMLLVSIVTFSQVIDRPSAGGTAIISVDGIDGNQVFVADNFTLASATDLGELDIFGTNSNAALAGNLTGFSVYIYTDATSFPSGDPNMAATGVVEMPNVPLTAITVVNDDVPNGVDLALSDYTIDLVAANGGTAINLPAGDYWLVIAAVTNDSLGTGRWNWSASAEVAAVEPVLIDPADLFGVGATSWTNVSGLIGATMSSAAWQLREPAAPIFDACGGQYVDSGGVDGDYAATESITTTINPDNAGDKVTATFTYVDIETSGGTGTQDGCWDFLTVYDGPDTSSPVLAATLCGEESGDGSVSGTATSVLSIGDSFTSTHASGALTFVFTSDGSIQETGWEADITCEPSCLAPTELTATNITTEGADLGITENNTPAATEWDGELGLPGFTPGTGTEVAMITTTDNPFTAVGLDSNITYEFYVRAVCSATDSSAWAGPLSFTTEEIPAVDLTCGDDYYDTGGQAGDYSNDESVTTVVVPDTAGEVVTVTFTYVDIETAGGSGTQDGCWDFLTVYDGPDISAPLLAATLCGETDGDGGVSGTATSVLEPGMSFTSTHASGALTFVFTSDSSVTETGWEANVTCGIISVANNVIDGFNFYPNPAKNTINLTALNTIDNVEVFNMVGQKVISQNLNTTTGQLDISRLSTGMYVMKVTSNDQVGSYQIVKK